MWKLRKSLTGKHYIFTLPVKKLRPKEIVQVDIVTKWQSQGLNPVFLISYSGFTISSCFSLSFTLNLPRCFKYHHTVATKKTWIYKITSFISHVWANWTESNVILALIRTLGLVTPWGKEMNIQVGSRYSFAV